MGLVRLPARLAAFAALAALALGAAAAPQKVLRVPFIIAETNFDPAFASDTYSNTVIDEILEAPLTYDMLARPYKLRLQTAAEMPEVTEGGRVYTVRLKKGIFFADDPAFGGARRELHARDYEFAVKRLIDPKIASPNAWLVEGRIEGIDAAAAEAKKAGRLDYDKPIPGIQVLDAHTIRFRLARPDYNFLYILAMNTLGAQAREVVEHYGTDIGAHPVGTGPFVLKEWRRSSRICTCSAVVVPLAWGSTSIESWPSGTGRRRWFRQRFRAIRYSHGRTLIARSSLSIAEWALANTSWSTSSASWRLFSIDWQKPSSRPL